MKDKNMIHYMPFTYLPEGRIRQLTRHLGPLAVQLPMDSLVSGPMQTAAEAGLLQFHPVHGVDQARLRQAVKAFIAWADLHQGNVGDLTGFFRTEQWLKMLHKEPGTAQLRTMIRNCSDTSNSAAPTDPNFEAALFLAMAHTYDRQQDDLDQEMRTVQTLEKRFGQILGKDEDPETFGSTLTFQVSDSGLDRGAYMTRRRIQSWARLTLANVTNDTVFITTSRAVWHDILDIVPEMLKLDYHLDAGKMSPSDEQLDTAIPLAELLNSLSSVKDPSRIAIDTLNNDSSQAAGTSFKLAVLTGCAPERFLTHLIHAEQDKVTPLEPERDSSNTIFGWI